jgi:hypothetical protein
MKSLHLRFSALTGAALLLAGLNLPLRAQDPDDAARGVGRISTMNGQVSVQRGDSGDWVAGIVNAPLIAGDHVATGPNSRAEVQFDSSQMFRMGANAEVHLTEMETGRFQMEFGKGIITYRVLRPTEATAEVDTPSVAVRPSRVGSYRISVNDAGETEVTVRAGSVDVFSPHGSQTVNTGQTMIARGDPSDPEYQVSSAVAPDEWDRWNDTRDRSLTQSASPQNVGPGVTGAEDLDGYGSWTNVDGYGPCWRPTVAVDWAPYQNGRWVWLDWYGWTWVSGDAWGWAPYHYGRWFYQANSGWLWYPGVRGVRHYWSPALVAFFGFGGGGFNLGFGFGFGNVGWVPLAPYEVFHPWWGGAYYGGFNRSINITNVNIASVYRNARIAHGATSIGAEDFRNGRFANVGHPTGEQLRTAGLVHGQVGIAPSRSNLAFGSQAAAFTPRTSGASRFFTHQQPTATQRVPFAQQQRALEQGSRTSGAAASPGRAGGFANDRPAAAGGGGSRPAQGGQSTPTNRPNGTGAAANGANGGFRRFGDPGSQSGGSAASNPGQRNDSNGRGGSQNAAPQNTRPSQPAADSGYRRFGSPGNSPQSSAPQQNDRPGSSTPSRGSAPSNSPPARGSGGGGGSTRPPAGGTSHPPANGGHR